MRRCSSVQSLVQTFAHGRESPPQAISPASSVETLGLYDSDDDDAAAPENRFYFHSFVPALEPAPAPLQPAGPPTPPLPPPTPPPLVPAPPADQALWDDLTRRRRLSMRTAAPPPPRWLPGQMFRRPGVQDLVGIDSLPASPNVSRPNSPVRRPGSPVASRAQSPAPTALSRQGSTDSLGSLASSTSLSSYVPSEQDEAMPGPQAPAREALAWPELTAEALTQHNARARGPYLAEEAHAWLRAAVAVHRDLALPGSLQHLAGCLAPQRDRLAVLLQHPAGPRLVDAWLGAPDAQLAPQRALQAKPPFTLNHGLNQEPPMGQRAAVPTPVFARLAPYHVAPGATLLAVTYNARAQAPGNLNVNLGVQGMVLAFDVPERPGYAHVVWHSGPGALRPWRQQLVTVRNPTAFCAPSRGALVVSSLEPIAEASGLHRVLDGVSMFVTQRAAATGAMRWVPRFDAPLAAPGAPAPKVRFDAEGDQTVVVTHLGASVYDTAPTVQRPQLRRPLRVSLPQQLAGCTDLRAESASFDTRGQFVAVNWSGQRGTQVVRWGEVVPTERVAGAVAAQPIAHAQRFLDPTVYRMVHFVGDRNLAVFAYAHALYGLNFSNGAPKPGARAQYDTGLRVLRTATRAARLVEFGRHPYFALVSAEGLRVYWMGRGRAFEASQRRLALREERPAYIEALRERGVTLSANVLTVDPWLSEDRRYLFAGLDDQCVHRWDLAPGEGHQPPQLIPGNNPEHPALRQPKRTLWACDTVMAPAAP